MKVSGFRFVNDKAEQEEIEDNQGKPLTWKRIRYILQTMGISQLEMRKLTIKDVQDLVGEYYAQRNDDFMDLARIIVPALGGSIDDLPEEAGAPKSFYASEEDEKEGIITEEALGFLGGMLSGSE